MLTRAEAAAQVAEHIIDHNAHGYSQPNRAGDGTTETLTLSSGEKVKIHGGDYDCSEMVRQCYAAVGVLPWSYWASYMWTGNEKEMLLSHGFKQIPVLGAASMKRGDVLLKSGHTEMYLGNGKQGGARGSYQGNGLTGTKGDQSGLEIRRDTYSPAKWTSAFRYVGAEKNDQEAGKAVNNAGLNYRVHAQKLGWLPAVHDGQTAGTTGQSLRLEAFKLTPPDGVELDVLVHLQGIGDKVYKGIQKGASSGTGSSTSDPIIGTVGEARRLEGFSIRCAKNTTGKKLKYRAHLQGTGWTPWKAEGDFCGTRGEKRRLEAIQLVME